MKEQFADLVENYMIDNGLSVGKLADALSCEAQNIGYGTVWMWARGPQIPGVDTLVKLARHGTTPLARQFGRDGLAIYGLRLIEGGE